MNTFASHLQAILSSSRNEEKTTSNQPLLKETPGALSQQFLPVPCSHTEASDLPVWQVCFEVLKTVPSVDICLEINGDIILGVEDAKSEVIDLCAYQDNLLGISRRHLKISPTSHDLLLTDLNSTNGTRKNGRLIQPNTPYSIYNGDILELGNLRLAINIVKAPMDQVILTEERSNIVNALTHISTVITSNLNAEDALDRILEIAVNLCKADEIALLLLDQDTHELYLRAEREIGDHKTRGVNVPVCQEYPVNEVLQTGKPLRNKIMNGQKSKIATGHLVEAALYIPLCIGEESIGVLVAMRREKGEDFSPEDERILSTIGKFSAIAIQNFQKHETANLKLQRKVEELSGYNKTLQALAKTNSLASIYSVLREQIRERWDVDNIGLWFVDQSTQKLIPFPKPTFHKSYSFGEELIGRVASSAEPILAADMKLFSEPTKAMEATLQLLARSAACVPIVENNQVTGVLGVFSRQENEFDEEDIQWLQAFSLVATPALRNVRLFEQVDKQRATLLAAVNMLPHPVMIVGQDEKMIVSNKAADALLNEIHSAENGRETSKSSCLMPLIALMNGLSESKWCTREITIGDRLYVATLEYASMVGTIILMQDVTDPVTGTCNRQHFRNLAEQAFQQARRYNKPLAALILGSEDLEQVINEKGTVIGDQILKEMASQLRGFLRTPDVLGRYQDNKFVIILPETPLENAKIVAERILKLSKKSGVAENYRVSPTLMIGAAMLDVKNDNSPDVFIGKAYQAYISANYRKGCAIKVYDEACDERPANV